MGQETRLDARVRLFKGEPPAEEGRRELLGFADLVIDGAFVINGIRILMGRATADKPAGPFIAFPSRKGSGPAQGKYFEVAHPITAEARSAAKEAVLCAYRRACAGP